jgi:hypothetical protein
VGGAILGDAVGDAMRAMRAMLDDDVAPRQILYEYRASRGLACLSLAPPQLDKRGAPVASAAFHLRFKGKRIISATLTVLPPAMRLVAHG